jgi:hypothetical protein
MASSSFFFASAAKLSAVRKGRIRRSRDMRRSKRLPLRLSMLKSCNLAPEPVVHGPMKHLLCLFLLTLSLRAADRAPNIVFILADDLGYTDVACFGSKYYETP